MVALCRKVYGDGKLGSRMKLKYTRAMVTAALNGDLENVEYKHDDGSRTAYFCDTVGFVRIPVFK